MDRRYTGIAPPGAQNMPFPIMNGQVLQVPVRGAGEREVEVSMGVVISSTTWTRDLQPLCLSRFLIHKYHEHRQYLPVPRVFVKHAEPQRTRDSGCPEHRDLPVDKRRALKPVVANAVRSTSPARFDSSPKWTSPKPQAPNQLSLTLRPQVAHRDRTSPAPRGKDHTAPRQFSSSHLQVPNTHRPSPPIQGTSKSSSTRPLSSNKERKDQTTTPRWVSNLNPRPPAPQASRSWPTDIAGHYEPAHRSTLPLKSVLRARGRDPPKPPNALKKKSITFTPSTKTSDKSGGIDRAEHGFM